MTCVASAVKSRLAEHQWRVPTGSMWKETFKRFAKTTGPCSGKHETVYSAMPSRRVSRSAIATPTDEFARDLVSIISRQDPPAHFWAGMYSRIIWFVHRKSKQGRSKSKVGKKGLRGGLLINADFPKGVNFTIGKSTFA